jgi:hypothetical protein
MDEDRETRTDEDVEAHTNKMRNDEAEVEAHSNKARNKARNDEGDDVEAHTNKMRNDEGDDVEAHVLKNAVSKGMTKL